MRRLTQLATPYRLEGYPDYLASLLHARGITTQEEAAAYLNPGPDQLHDPFLLNGMAEACRLIKEADAAGQVVAVYGDYDADGVCASAILLEALQALHIKAFSYIPTRQGEGYGLNREAVSQLAQQASLLLSVDCGITAHEEVALAKSLGMQVIITDHHTLPEHLPKADAIIHPQLAQYPNPELCGAGVAFKLACALLGTEAAWSSLDLAALATVADMVPLLGENRALVSLGLAAMKGSCRPGLAALMKVAGIRAGLAPTSEHIAYQLAPRLNATGRLADAQDALSLLLCQDTNEAERLAGQMDQLNQQRRAIEQATLKAASAQVAGMDLSRQRSIVVAGPDWNPGVVGLTAGKLVERWNYPAIALCRQGEEWTGSGRSAGQVDLYAALAACAPHLSRFGGHTMAAGLALPEENLPAFTAAFDQAVRDQLGEGDLVPETVYDTALSLAEVSLATIDRLDQLAPFGVGNPPPLFLMENLRVITARAVGSDGAHLKLTVGDQGAVREGIAFSFGQKARSLGRSVSLVGSVERNEFNGKTSAQLMVRALIPGENAFYQDSLLEAKALSSLLAGPTGDAPQAEVRQIAALPEVAGNRGTLVLAHSHHTANALRERFPDWQIGFGRAADPRSFNALVYAPDFSQHFAGYTRLVFADGLPDQADVSQAVRATGAQEVLVLPQSAALHDLLARLAPDVEGLRAVYQQLKQGKTAGFSADSGKDFIALVIFQQLGLVQLDQEGSFLKLLPMKRIDPTESPLYNNLTG